jgi:DNA-binding transcriptional regulator YdaS (Cro superfamily)
MHPIKIFCQKNNLTQKEFALKAGLYPQEVSNFIQGCKRPGQVAAAKIFKATHGEITFSDLRPDLLALLTSPEGPLPGV